MIPNKNGRVVADGLGPDDTHCRVVWFGPPEDGLHRRIFEGPVQPIEEYSEVLAWAHELANQMTYPLYVLPMTDVEVLQTDEMKHAVSDLSDQERGELRRHVVARLTTIMRDSNDSVVRADAYDILKTMKVVRP